MQPDATGFGKFKMADTKPELLITQFVDKISTKFKRLYLCFLGPAIQWSYCEFCTSKQEVEIQDGGQQTGNTNSFHELQITALFVFIIVSVLCFSVFKWLNTSDELNFVLLSHIK